MKGEKNTHTPTLKSQLAYSAPLYVIYPKIIASSRARLENKEAWRSNKKHRKNNKQATKTSAFVKPDFYWGPA